MCVKELFYPKGEGGRKEGKYVSGWINERDWKAVREKGNK
jgi:hypothetical protein